MIKTSDRSADIPTDILVFEFQYSSQEWHPVWRCVWLTGGIILHDTAPLNLWVNDVFSPNSSIPTMLRHLQTFSKSELILDLKLSSCSSHMNFIYNMLLIFNKNRSRTETLGGLVTSKINSCVVCIYLQR